MMKRGQVKNLKQYKTPQEEPAEMLWVGATPGSVCVGEGGLVVVRRILLQPFTPFGCHGDTARGLHFFLVIYLNGEKE